MTEQSTQTSHKHPPVLSFDIRDNSYCPGSSFCRITVNRNVANVSGKTSGVRIKSIDLDRLVVVSSSLLSPSNSPSSDHQKSLKIGDELVFINDVEIKPSYTPEYVMQVLNVAASSSSPSVRFVVIRPTDRGYRERAIMQRFQNNYENITWTSSSCVTLTPKDNPSILQATLFPLWKTRFKYEVRFDNSTGELSYQDMYKITFNRSNGASPQQQERIQENWKIFEERLHELEAQMEFDLDCARTVALESSQKGKD